MSEEISQRTKDFKRQHEILKCLNIISRNSYGLNDLIYEESTVGILALNIQNDDNKLNTLTIEVLNEICWSSNQGYEMVLRALEMLAMERRLQNRFANLINLLTSSDLELKVATMNFINCLVESPLDAKTRQSIRLEFIRLGIKDILLKLQSELGDDIQSTEISIVQHDLDKKRKQASKREEKKEIHKPIIDGKRPSVMVAFDPDDIENVRTRASVIQDTRAKNIEIEGVAKSKEADQAFKAFMSVKNKETQQIDTQSSDESEEEDEKEDLLHELLTQVTLFLENCNEGMKPEADAKQIIKILEKNASYAESHSVFLSFIQKLSYIPPEPAMGSKI